MDFNFFCKNFTLKGMFNVGLDCAFKLKAHNGKHIVF